MIRLSWKRIGALSLLMFGLLLASGCGPGWKERGVVRGKVTIDGKALNMGTIQFLASNNRTGTATIKEDGTYEMLDAPVGECKIGITIPNTGPAAKMAMGAKGMPGAPGGLGMSGPGAKAGTPKPPPGVIGGGDGMQMTTPTGIDFSKAIKVPDRYGNPETSGLTFTVIKGEQTYDIPLTP